MMDTLAAATIVIPWRPTGLHDARSDALDHVLGMWEDSGADVCVCCEPYDLSQGAPWCKALAIMDGVRRTEKEFVVVSDADVVPAWWALLDALTAVEMGGATWSTPHTRVRRLTRDATHSAIGRNAGYADMLGMPAEQDHPGHAGGGMLIARRATLLDCPPDPRFVGWGQEDDAWALALVALHGLPYRVPSRLVHLWHEPQERLDRVRGSAKSVALYERYRAAANACTTRDSGPMRRLIEGCREGWGPCLST